MRNQRSSRLASTSTWRKLGEFNAQDLANSLWAYVTMGRRPAALQARIDEHVARMLGELNALDASQVLSAS